MRLSANYVQQIFRLVYSDSGLTKKAEKANKIKTTPPINVTKKI